MNLLDAMTHEDARTENGALTHSTSSNRAVDLFFQINAMRQRSEQDIINLFIPAIEENPLAAMKILFYSRDVRKGQGERRTFRTIFRYLAQTRPELVRLNLDLVPFFGRWDDLLVLVDTELEGDAFAIIREALLENQDGLCAKWMPREKSSNKVIAGKLRRFLGLSPRRYRKVLSELTQVVEQAMCSDNWDAINYEHVPSYAMKNYRKAFARRNPERWEEYKSALQSGDAKVNAAVLYPHDLVRPMISGYGYTGLSNDDAFILNEQWKALPNYMEENSERVIPLSDVSASMSGLPMQVSIALGLYISERNIGAFQDAFITFSERPKLEIITGKTLQERANQLSNADWGYNTNLEAVFKLILNRALEYNVAAEDMPTMILILSDMEFDQAAADGKDMTLMNNIRAQYEVCGYELPKIVFWNLRAAQSNFPVKSHESGTALVSGFSPSILKQILAGKDFSPAAIMHQTINQARYEAIRVSN